MFGPEKICEFWLLGGSVCLGVDRKVTANMGSIDRGAGAGRTRLELACTAV